MLTELGFLFIRGPLPKGVAEDLCSLTFLQHDHAPAHRKDNLRSAIKAIGNLWTYVSKAADKYSQRPCDGL